jgi:hypothetical protein
MKNLSTPSAYIAGLIIYAATLSATSAAQEFRAPPDIATKLEGKESERVEDQYPPLKVIDSDSVTDVVFYDGWQPLDTKCDGIEGVRDEYNREQRQQGNPDLGPIIPTIKSSIKKTKDQDRFLVMAEDDEYSYITDVRIEKNIVRVRGKTYGRFLERSGAFIEETQEKKYPPVLSAGGVIAGAILSPLILLEAGLSGGMSNMPPSIARFAYGCTTKGLRKKYISLESSKRTGRYAVRELERRHVVSVNIFGQIYSTQAEFSGSEFVAEVDLPDAVVLSAAVTGTSPLNVECTSCVSSGHFRLIERVPTYKSVLMNVDVAPLREAALARVAAEKERQEKERRAELARREQLRREEQARQEQQRLADQAERERKKKQAQLDTMRSL